MDPKATTLALYRTASDRDVTYLAAGFAYYAFVSVIPLVLLALVVGSLLGGERIAQQLILVAGDFLPEAGEDLVTDALTTEAGRTEATVVALGVAIWGALKVFRGLSLAFDRIYDEVAEDSLLTEIREGLVVIVAGTGALALMIVVGTVLGIVSGAVPYAGVLSWVVLLVGLVLVFLPIYYVLPPISIDLAEAVPGALFAAVGWAILQAGFQLYAANAGRYQAYGAVGGVLLFVTWLYFAGIVILFGAVLNVVLSRPALVE
ncbi:MULTISPECIES: YihY/virulence factor BrkB family protein [Natrialba]|uniref:YihY/virulence factor BrkB family protein n=1 Tax=Natrialba swarupiae TaxID=2448032 RepID=A0A5D5AJI0_9EURY|nr:MULTISPECIES: YihY/virulence factor BrkB family protein [Natrialba]MWV38261.1 YihY family inner membrane protein [Natrialba sp. INN-245]TYT61324.1 YihY/virulence factor BrkB family protein [Natrialba swarupiae]